MLAIVAPENAAPELRADSTTVAVAMAVVAAVTAKDSR
jgi:hypothetical protein